MPARALLTLARLLHRIAAWLSRRARKAGAATARAPAAAAAPSPQQQPERRPDPRTPRQQAILAAEWARFGPLPDQREGESGAAYVARLKSLDLSAAGPPIRLAVEAAVNLCSAAEMAKLVKVDVEQLLKTPPERN
jgi:hypothetical protein